MFWVLGSAKSSGCRLECLSYRKVLIIIWNTSLSNTGWWWVLTIVWNVELCIENTSRGLSVQHVILAADGEVLMAHDNPMMCYLKIQVGDRMTAWVWNIWRRCMVSIPSCRSTWKGGYFWAGRVAAPVRQHVVSSLFLLWSLLVSATLMIISYCGGRSVYPSLSPRSVQSSAELTD